MAFRIKRRETMPHAITRMARKELAGARDADVVLTTLDRLLDAGAVGRARRPPGRAPSWRRVCARRWVRCDTGDRRSD